MTSLEHARDCLAGAQEAFASREGDPVTALGLNFTLQLMSRVGSGVPDLQIMLAEELITNAQAVQQVAR